MNRFDTATAWQLLDGAEAVVVSKTHPIAARVAGGYIDLIDTNTGASFGYRDESDYPQASAHERAAARLAEAEEELA